MDVKLGLACLGFTALVCAGCGAEAAEKEDRLATGDDTVCGEWKKMDPEERLKLLFSFRDVALRGKLKMTDADRETVRQCWRNTDDLELVYDYVTDICDESNLRLANDLAWGLLQAHFAYCYEHWSAVAPAERID